MRAFVAAFPAAESRQAIARALTDVRRQLPSQQALRWVPERNYHVTLRFLGSVEQAEPLVAALKSVVCPGAIDCTVTILAGFPSAKRPSVYALTVDSDGRLEALAEGVNSALSSYGKPDKPFRSHLTVARCRDKPPRLEADLQLSFRLESFGLFRSETLPEGARYTAIASFPLR